MASRCPCRLAGHLPTFSGQLFCDPTICFGVATAEGTASAEKPVVFTALQAAKHQVDAAEEKRLLYDGLTRTRDQLILTASETPKPERACAFNLLGELAWQDTEVTLEELSASHVETVRFGVQKPVTFLSTKLGLK